MTLYEMTQTFLSLDPEDQLHLIKSFRQKRYDLATNSKARPKAVKAQEQKNTKAIKKFQGLSPELQEEILKQLELKLGTA